jgi:hypothetical protein
LLSMAAIDGTVEVDRPDLPLRQPNKDDPDPEFEMTLRACVHQTPQCCSVCAAHPCDCFPISTTAFPDTEIIPSNSECRTARENYIARMD